jgi:hypothetical protein
MVVQVKCPSCGRTGKVPDSTRGQKARCPACKHIFPVPAEAKQASKPAPVVPPKRRQELWFYKELGQEIGPVTLEIIAILARKGEIGPDSMIRKFPDGPWVVAGRMKGLFGDSGSAAR